MRCSDGQLTNDRDLHNSDGVAFAQRCRAKASMDYSPVDRSLRLEWTTALDLSGSRPARAAFSPSTQLVRTILQRPLPSSLKKDAMVLCDVQRGRARTPILGGLHRKIPGFEFSIG